MSTPADDSSEEFDGQVKVAFNQRRRRLAVLLADISYSMNEAVPGGGTRISALNAKLTDWAPAVRAGAGSTLQDVEFAVITFGDGGVRITSGNPAVPAHEDGGAFVPTGEFTMGPFTADGVTPMVEAIELAIDLTQRRQRYLMERHGLNTGQPRLIMFSDGQPTDRTGSPTQTWRAVADRLRAMRAGRKLHFFAFAVPGADSATLSSLTPAGGYYDLPELDFKLLLDLILVATSADNPYAALQDVLGHTS